MENCLATAALVAVTFAVRKVVRLIWPPHLPDQPLAVVPFTTYPGNARFPSFSPDGQEIAFGWDGNRPWPSFELYVQMIGSGPPKRLTNTPSLNIFPAWSPDGKSIAFTRHHPVPDRKPVEIVLIPALGGPEVVLDRTAFGKALSWSPDGRYLIFSDATPIGAAIILLDVEKLNRRQLTEPQNQAYGDFIPAFSPDGKEIAFERAISEQVSQLTVLTLASGRVRILWNETSRIDGLAWIGSDIVYSAKKSGVSRLWRISEGSAPRLLDVGDNAYTPAISERAHRLTYSQVSVDNNIWRIQFGKGNTMAEERSVLIASTRQDFQPVLSPDETRVAFASDRSGAQENLGRQQRWFQSNSVNPFRKFLIRHAAVVSRRRSNRI